MVWLSQKVRWACLPGLLLALVNFGLWEVKAWQPLENAAYNALFQLRGSRPWDERIVVIGIDDKSLGTYGFFPWARNRYTTLLTELKRAQPGLIMLDLIFSEASPDDQELARVMLENGQVVLPLYFDPQTHFPILPTDELERAAVALGHIRRQTDTDGVTRSLELSMSLESGAQIPSFVLAGLQAYELLGHGSIILPPNKQNLVWLNWPSSMPRSQPQFYSAVDVIEGNVDPEQFRDKIVLIGITATGLDPLITPFDLQLPASGVFLHAVAFNNLLQQNDLTNLMTQRWLIALILLGLGSGFSYILSLTRPTRRLFVAMLCLGLWGSVGLIALEYNALLPIAMPFGLLISTWGGVMLTEQLRASRLLDSQIQQLWRAYHDDLIQAGSSATALTEILEPSPLSKVTQLGILAEQFGRSQSAQAAIARSLTVGLVAADHDGHVWFCNPVAAEHLSLSIGDVLVTQLCPDWLSLMVWQHAYDTLQSTQQGTTWELEKCDRNYILRLEPLLPWTVSALTPTTLDSPSALAGCLLILEDITEIKVLQAKILDAQVQRNEALAAQNHALAIARNAAERASALKSSFLANMSHEIRTPMTAVIGVIDLLQDTPLNREQHNFVEIIQTSSQNLLMIIDEILDFSKLEAGEMRLEKIPMDLEGCLESVVDLLAPQAQQKELEFIAWVHPNVERHVLGDPTRLRQILMNLISNAIKFTEQGSISIEVQSLMLSESHTTLQISVVDTGIGIAAQDQVKLFKSFSQVDASTTRKFGGTGLGLAICKHLVELMGGQITVESELGVGTRFTFNLKMPRQTEVRRLPIALSDHLRSQRILLVTSSTLLQQVIQSYADHWQLSLTAASTGSEALSHLQQSASTQPYTLVILDWKLRDGEAPQWVESLRQQAISPLVPLWLLVPLQQRDRARSLSPEWIQGWITKPLKTSRLLADLEATLLHEQPIPETLNLTAQNRITSVDSFISPTSRTNSDHLSPKSQLRILIVEDIVINQRVMIKQLESLGYATEVANNGSEALDQLSHQFYDLVFMDCQMPILDGFEATRELRRRENGQRRTTVIALTASAMQENQDQCFEAGMDDFLPKPVRKADLKTMIERWTTSPSMLELNRPQPELLPEDPDALASQVSVTTIAPEISVLDSDYLEGLTEGDLEFQSELLNLYIHNTEELLKHFQQSIALQEWGNLAKLAHQLKGSSGNTGAFRLQAYARQLETLAQQGESELISLCFSRLIAEWENFQDHINANTP